MFFSIPMREATACDRLVEKFPPRLIRRSNPARAVGGTQKNGMGRLATRSCASISTSMSSPSTPHPHASRALHRPRGVGTDGPSRPTPSSPSAEVSTRRTTPFSNVERRTSNVERRTSNVECRTSNVERRMSNVASWMNKMYGVGHPPDSQSFSSSFLAQLVGP